VKKWQQVKRNHHYVWGFYLRQWGLMNDVFYLSPKGKISSANVKALAKDSGFYKINMLNEEDIDFIQAFSAKSPPETQEMHMKVLRNFVVVSNMSHMLNRLNFQSREKENLQEILHYNSLEDLHSVVEKGVLPTFKQLCSGNKKILNSNQNMVSFCSYLGHQITRTESFKDNSLEAIAHGRNRQQAPEKFYELIDKNWWFLSHMFGMNVGMSLHPDVRGCKHIFVENNTRVPFITSDSPAINIHSSLPRLARMEPPEKLDLYFPLSPKYAYMVNDSSDYDHLEKTVDEETVRRLNGLIYAKSEKTVFGNDKDTIGAAIKFEDS